MWNEPLAIIVAMFAIIAGLMVFSILLMLGVALIARLRLPQDPPEALLYEPPAPKMPSHIDPMQASATAQVQAELRHIYARALAVRHAAAECFQLRDEWKELPARRTVGLDASSGILERCGAEAQAADSLANQELFRLDRELRSGSAILPRQIGALATIIAEQEIMVQGALARARACVLQVPPEKNVKHLILMLFLAVVVVVWVVAFAMRQSNP